MKVGRPSGYTPVIRRIHQNTGLAAVCLSRRQVYARVFRYRHSLVSDCLPLAAITRFDSQNLYFLYKTELGFYSFLKAIFINMQLIA